jgi:hypothetical protein
MSSPLPHRCAILVPSCDDYADLWRPFWTQFWRHWPDCPFPVYLGSNALTYDDARVTTIPASGGRNWTNRVREQIRAIDSTYVLLILEDFFMRSRIQTADVLRCLESAEALDAAAIRLIPRPGPDVAVEGYANLGRILPGAPYRVSTQAAIWRRDVLLDLMRDGESIWEFELKGSERSRAVSREFYGVFQPVLTYRHHVVERGRWFRHEARRFGRMNIGVDFARRPIMDVPTALRWRAHKTVAVLLGLIPWPQRLKLKSWLRPSRGQA